MSKNSVKHLAYAKKATKMVTEVKKFLSDDDLA